jgi:ribosome-associated protein
MDIRVKQRAVVEALEDVKARDIVVFNVAAQTAYFERVVIASGDSNRQVNALATHVQEKLKSLGANVVGVEGRRNGEWVLVDLGDIVVHVMHPAVRSHYNLEELWGDKEVKLAKAEKPKKVKSAKKAKRKPAARRPAALKKKPARGKTARRRSRK